MSSYRPVRTQGGLIQSSIRKSRPSPSDVFASEGLLLRGVVLTVYKVDEEVYPGFDAPGQDQIGLFCDVFAYSATAGQQVGFLPRVLLTNDRGGMHEGDIWIPRASTIDVTGLLELNKGTNPADLDGDHVLVGFMDNKINLPVVVRSIPHPKADLGKVAQGASAGVIGERLKIRTTDGEPRMWKHRGACWGADTNGNWVTDLTRAHSGVYNPDGSEPDPPEDGTNGSYELRIQPGSTYKIIGPNDELIEIAADGTITLKTAVGTVIDAATVQIGAAAVQPAMRGTQWQALHTAYDVALTALFAAYATILPKVGGIIPLTPPELLVITNATTAFTTAQAALVAAGPTGALSATVTVKD